MNARRYASVRVNQKENVAQESIKNNLEVLDNDTAWRAALADLQGEAEHHM